MIQSNHHKIKRFSSSSQLPNLPLKKANHSQSTLQFHNKAPNLLTNCGDSSNDSKNIQLFKSSQPLTHDAQDDKPSDLEKLDTNKEEEIRLASIENDIMHKAFI